jgi:nucleotide-binding universal stress UspA family protein
MFKHMLVPTDGSALSLEAAKKAVVFAKATGARITAFYAGVPFTVRVYGDFVPPDFITPQEYDKQTRKTADRHLSAIEALAAGAGVSCARHYIISDSPWEAIVRAAKAKKCDLIFMASHGRRGLSGLLLGSETQKVLTHTKIPVLVHR